MSVQSRVYEEVARTMLGEAVRKIIEAVRNDQLIKVMSLEETSEAFVLQRVAEIVDIIYKQDREKLIESLVAENNSLKARLRSQAQAGEGSELARLRAEISQLQARLRTEAQSRAVPFRDAEAERRLQAEVKGLNARLQEVLRENRELKDRFVDLGRSRVDGPRQNDLEREVAQLQKQLRAREEELQQLGGKLGRLKKELDEAKKQQGRGARPTKEVDLLRLQSQVEELKSKVKDLKDLLKRREIEKQDLQELLRNVEKKASENAYNNEQAARGLEAAHHETVVRLKKEHQLQLEQLDAYHKKEHKSLGRLNEEALEDLTRIHRDELQRTRRQAEFREKSLVERVQQLEKNVMQFEQNLSDSKKKAEQLRHPRFSIDEIARLHEELALKDAALLSREGEKNVLGSEFERMAAQRGGLLGENQQLKEQIQNLKAANAKLMAESNEMERVRLQQAEALRNNLQNQIYRLVRENQKLANELSLYQSRYQQTMAENISLEIRQRSLAESTVSTTHEAGVLTEQLKSLLLLTQSQAAKINELAAENNSIAILQERLKLTESLESKYLTLQREASEVAHRNEILKVDFEEMSRQLRELHASHKATSLQLSRAKGDLERAGSVIQHSRQTAQQSSEQEQSRKQIMMAKMESATNQLVARFHEEQETLLRNFREYQDRVREEIGQMVVTLRGKYEYILELRNQERQREKQQLVEQFESEANSLIRDISEGYEVRELQLISELERTKMATQAQQLEFLRNSETEMASRALREDSLLRRRGAQVTADSLRGSLGEAARELNRQLASTSLTLGRRPTLQRRYL